MPTVFVVNSLADVLSPPAGTVTLRSAIKAANQAAGSGVSNTIDLGVAGTYRITTFGNGATDNSAGEFAITGADGYNLLIDNTSGGRAVIDGGGLNRVFDVNPAAAPGTFQVTFEDLTIADGVASGDGGGVRAQGSANVELQDSDLLDNVASGGGGGASVATGVLYFLNSTVVGNDASHGGGGATASSSDTYVFNSFFRGNVATSFGGALDIGGSGMASLTRADFTANLASSGGAIADEAGTTSLVLDGSTLDHNRAIRGNGGALFAPVSATDSVNIDSSLFLDNTANDASLGEGGAIDQSGGYLGIDNSQLSGNVADAFGGAIDFGGTTLFCLATTIDHSRTDGEGGALDFGGTGTGPLLSSGSTLTDVTLAFNSAYGGGGAIYDAGTGDLTLQYDTINANDGGQGGGGIDLASASKLAIGGTIIARDTASLTGQGPDILTGPTGQVTDEGSNLVGNASGSTGFNPGALIGTPGHAIDPGLGPLLDNGATKIYTKLVGAGVTGSLRDVQTEALATTSPAFKASHFSASFGPAKFPLTSDERGFPLPAANPSIGAYQPHYDTISTPAQVYVENLYEILLNRPAEPGGLAYWASQVAPSGANGGLIVRFESSDEYRVDQIDSFYAAYYNQTPDATAVASWLKLLDSGALTLGQLQADFLGSSKYFSDYGGNVVTVIEPMYEELLDRVPSTGEVDGWAQALGSGVAPDVVALDFVLSTEDESDLVSADYQAYLGRKASSAEVIFWVKAVSTSTDPKTQLIGAILGSPEAYADRT